MQIYFSVVPILGLISLIEDLTEIYPHVRIRQDDAVWDALKRVYQAEPETRFILVS